ncbi:twin-arginine translocation signal domain-containing protein [Halopiger djelfimassiliensis]|uniref:twin-arginine translocation signal domain-containing protein n=1 Tax=Halopiger djelfimassiliensis TaxID=1293047 RepID=UPI0012B532A1|nr:twin-arginine translocation signal domain-containing protein [Halopiger djelfimassiliensis]
MVEKDPQFRRSFLKRSAVAGSIGGTLLASSQPVGASNDGELTLRGTGEYLAIVTDGDATSDDADSVDNKEYRDETWVESTINGGKHKVYYDGYVSTLRLTGDLSGWTYDNEHVYGDITVEGSKTDYSVGATNYLWKDGKKVDNPYTGTLEYNDTHTFSTDGPMNEFETHGDSGNSSITYRFEE